MLLREQDTACIHIYVVGILLSRETVVFAVIVKSGFYIFCPTRPIARHSQSHREGEQGLEISASYGSSSLLHVSICLLRLFAFPPLLLISNVHEAVSHMIVSIPTIVDTGYYNVVHYISLITTACGIGDKRWDPNTVPYGYQLFKLLSKLYDHPGDYRVIG